MCLIIKGEIQFLNCPIKFKRPVGKITCFQPTKLCPSEQLWHGIILYRSKSHTLNVLDLLDTKHFKNTHIYITFVVLLQTPNWKGFKGTIECLDESRCVVNGEVSIISDNEIEVTELPIKTWTQNYKESVLEPLLQGTEKTPQLISWVLGICLWVFFKGGGI